MALRQLRISRLEGDIILGQDDDGVIRLGGSPTRNIEARLLGRRAQDAVFLTQTFSAASGVSHGLAAVLAIEDAFGLSVSTNGFLARDLLHTLSLVHAHVRTLYFQAMADYLPLSALAGYRGSMPSLVQAAERLARPGAVTWESPARGHAFAGGEADLLLEHTREAGDALIVLQQMMGMLGGKFPVVMTLVPGGMTVKIAESGIIRLDTLLRRVERFVMNNVAVDSALILESERTLKSLGWGPPAFISAGGLGAETSPESALFNAGVFMDGKLVPPGGTIAESTESSFYSLRRTGGGARPVMELDAGKPGAYSWIKSPHLQHRVLDVGPLARTVIGNFTGATSRHAALVAQFGKVLGAAPQDANTVAGRMIARAGEVELLVIRCREILQQLQPGQPFVEPGQETPLDTASSSASIEAPAGALLHRVAWEGGRIATYDIISPSTWQGAPEHSERGAGSLEKALNGARLDISAPADATAASRIVHSFAFSMTDAVH